MNAKRLLKLADFLDALPRQKFDFGTIAHQNGKPMREALMAGKESCGTVACAVGWMPVVFPRGLKWDEKYAGSEEFPSVVLRQDPDVDNVLAAAAWFAISPYDADLLFVPGDADGGYSGLKNEATPKQVARHIRKWVREQQKAAA